MRYIVPLFGTPVAAGLSVAADKWVFQKISDSKIFQYSATAVTSFFREGAIIWGYDKFAGNTTLGENTISKNEFLVYTFLLAVPISCALKWYDPFAGEETSENPDELQVEQLDTIE